MPVKVIYINHYGVYHGAQRSLIELIRNFPGNAVEPYVITPSGKIVHVLRENNIDYDTLAGLSKFDHTRIGYYRKWRWLILIREFLFLFPTLSAIIRNRKKIKQADIVHLNENTCLVPLIVIGSFFKTKIVLHARAVMNTDQRLLRTKLIRHFFNKYANAIISIDYNVRASLPNHSNILVVHNGLAVDAAGNPGDELLINKLKSIKRKKLTLGFVGVLDKNKGIFELIEAIQKCKAENVDVNLFLLGLPATMGKGILKTINGKLFGNNNAQFSVDEFIEQLNVKDCVHQLGFSQDLKSFYSNIDVVCFPSYYDAPGRPVFEGAFFKRPSILAVSKPQDDTFIPDFTGKQVIAGDPDSIFRAIEFFYHNPDKVEEYGGNAEALAIKNFDIKKNALKVFGIYESLLKTQ